jgi:hypothetical protein
MSKMVTPFHVILWFKCAREEERKPSPMHRNLENTGTYACDYGADRRQSETPSQESSEKIGFAVVGIGCERDGGDAGHVKVFEADVRPERSARRA